MLDIKEKESTRIIEREDRSKNQKDMLMNRNPGRRDSRLEMKSARANTRE